MVFAVHAVARPRAPARGASAGRKQRGVSAELDALAPGAALDRERSDRADADERRADDHGGIHAIDELLAGVVAAGCSEHRCQDRYTEHTAELTDGVVCA